MKRIAVIGSGIAGLASAWILSAANRVVLFEANDYLGGHTHTHDIVLASGRYRVDTGFIVHNPVHYPLLTAFFDALDVAYQPTTMSFSVMDEVSGLEYNATTLDALFCQRNNLVSPRFWSMLRDLHRFYRNAPALLTTDESGPTLGDYLRRENYSDAFRDLHLVPMASALWSSPAEQILEFPARYLVRFMANHHMLQLSTRPAWRVVTGGSRSYIDALVERWSVETRLSAAAQRITRTADHVVVEAAGQTEEYDEVVLACHSDQALALLADPSPEEHQVLSAIPYQANEVILHTDASVMPRKRKAWAAWNAHVPTGQNPRCTVSYWMNLLQSLDTPEPLIVSLNRSDGIDPARILKRMTYRHPIYTEASVAAQTRRDEIQGIHRTWYVGAYWGWGFHEDGIRSAVDMADAMGITTQLSSLRATG